MEFVLHLAEFALIIHLIVKELGWGRSVEGGAWRKGQPQVFSGRFKNTENPSKEQRGGVQTVFLPSGKQFSGSMASSAISENSSSSSPGFLRSTVLPSDRLMSSFCWLKQETSGYSRMYENSLLFLFMDTHF